MLSSRLIFSAVIILIIACSSESDKQYYENAIQLREGGKYLESLSEFEKLLDKYPGTQYRCEVLFEIGKYYHGGIVKNLSQTEVLLKAIESYRKIFVESPDCKHAPNALFMIGFIQANELHQLDSANVSYNKFLKKYPGHELATSAKAELENLGVPAEEILSRKLSKTDSEK